MSLVGNPTLTAQLRSGCQVFGPFSLAGILRHGQRGGVEVLNALMSVRTEPLRKVLKSF